jgi:RHS repeat-associated protein
MLYFPNGNVAELQLQGSYQSNFPNSADMNFLFEYDKSNRLLNAISNYSGITNGNNLRNTYDKDGNILTLKRYLSDGYLMDNFNYTFYPQTNKLKNTGNEFEDYEYDLNGNLKKDDMNKNLEIKYDHRNLITFIKHLLISHHGFVYTQAIYYYYDEAGNRIRKIILQAYQRDPVIPEDLDNLEEYPEYDEEAFNQAAEEYFNQLDQPVGPGDPEPGNGEGDNPFLVWYVVRNEFYIRGVEGNELVIFSVMSGVSNVEKYNFFGSSNEGYIDADDRKHYYLKDHLGTVRVVLNENNEIVSAQDYDMWGFLMAGRSFDSNVAKYKFTGKERDKESNYDYFGARYYDARIGRWGQVEPLMEKYYSFSPYCYGLINPLALKDINGLDVFIAFTGLAVIYGGTEVNLDDYSSESEGAVKLLYDITQKTSSGEFQDLSIKGYYSSFGESEINKAYDYIINNLENEDENVILYGYSLGGFNINKLATKLVKSGINNPIILITVDAYYPFISGLDVSSGVYRNYNFYQNTDITGIRGYPSKSQKKKDNIINIGPIENQSHTSVDEYTNPFASAIIMSYINRWRERK